MCGLSVSSVRCGGASGLGRRRGHPAAFRSKRLTVSGQMTCPLRWPIINCRISIPAAFADLWANVKWRVRCGAWARGWRVRGGAVVACSRWRSAKARHFPFPPEHRFAYGPERRNVSTAHRQVEDVPPRVRA